MPSTRNPTSLNVGPGRLPANVVTASALTAPAVAADEPDTDFSVVSVTGTASLSRRGKYLTVLVTAGTYTITLPAVPQVGDMVTFLVTGGTGLVTIDGAGSDPIHSFTTTETLGSGSFPARSYVCTSPGGAWATFSEKPAVQELSANTALTRAGATQLVLVNTAGGDVTVTLPQRSQVGDRITFVKIGAANNLNIFRFTGSDQIDGVRSQLGLVANQSSITLVRTSGTFSAAWTTVTESTSIIEATVTTTLAANTASETHVLVRTNDAAWSPSSKSIFLPAVGKLGQLIIISDADGNASAAPITVSGSILGVSSVSGTAAYVISDNYGAVTIMAKTSSQWVIVSAAHGLVENFSSLARADSRSDSAIARLRATPMFNWSHRRVAVHAEFTGLITNILPVDGFTTMGSAVLSRAPGVVGTVGHLRITVPAADNGGIHLGDGPTDGLFNPQQLLGFRAIVTPVTANPGTDYDVLVGFGDNMFETSDIAESTRLGSNSLYMYTTNTGFWAGARNTSGGAASVSSNAVAAGSRYVLEYLFSGTTWDLYVNGQRTAGGSNQIPTAMLNFGLLILKQNGAVDDYVVDVDSLTVFTLDLGDTRHNP